MPNIRILSLEDLMTLLNKVADPGIPAGARPQYEWYMRVSKMISEYSQIGRDQFQIQSLVTPKAIEAWEALCEELCQLPLTAEQDAVIASLEKRNNTLAKVVMYFMNKEKSADFTITLEELAELKAKRQILGVADCAEHGIHLDIPEIGSEENPHVH